MKVSFSDSDKGFAALLKLAGKRGAAKVGVVGRAAEAEHKVGPGEEPITNAELALIHEFGEGRAPERSFLRASFDANREKYLARMRQYVGEVYDGRMVFSTALGRLGLEAASDTREFIRAGIAPANTPSTIAAKGSSKPLIDSSQLINAITHQVDLDGATDPDGTREK